MREGIYLGPGGQLIEFQNHCIIFGMYIEYINKLGPHYKLQLQYVCGQENYILSGFQYLGEL